MSDFRSEATDLLWKIGRAAGMAVVAWSLFALTGELDHTSAVRAADRIYRVEDPRQIASSLPDAPEALRPAKRSRAALIEPALAERSVGSKHPWP